MASLIGGLLSGRCPPPGPAFMAVLLVAGVGGGGGRGALAVGGGEWRATAALVTCSASLLRVGLLLLENGASVGPLPEVSVLVLGGLVGLGAGNLSLGLVFPPRRLNNSSSTALNPDAEADRWHDTPPPAVLRRFVLAVALASSVALATGGPPAALEPLRRPLVAGALGAVLLVALCGALCGCTRGAEGAHRGARGAYGKVAFDDREAHEVELKPFVGGGAGGDETDDDGGRRDDDYLDEEDGYLADEGETEHTRSSRRGGQGEGGGGAGAGGAGGGRGVRGRGRLDFSTLPPARPSRSPLRRGGGGAGGEIGKAAAPLAPGGATANADPGGETKPRPRPKEAPPAQSLFSVGHTVEL